MEEKKPQEIFTVGRTITKDVIEKTEGEIINREHLTLADDLGRKIAEYFGFTVTNGIHDDAPVETHALQVVAMTLEEFERLQDADYRCKELDEETEEE